MGEYSQHHSDYGNNPGMLGSKKTSRTQETLWFFTLDPLSGAETKQ